MYVYIEKLSIFKCPVQKHAQSKINSWVNYYTRNPELWVMCKTKTE